MARPAARHRSRLLSGGRASSFILVLAMLLMLSLVLLMLLALGILSIPVSPDGADSESSFSSSLTVDVHAVKRSADGFAFSFFFGLVCLLECEESKHLDLILGVFFGRGDGLGERGEQWTEILSWEPRAFVYHNFLVSDCS